MRDVTDYLKRLLFSIFLCPVAAGFYFLAANAGFSIEGFLSLMSSTYQHYMQLDDNGRAAFAFQVYAGWAVLAFVFMLTTFAVNPPRFVYELRRRGGKEEVVVK